MGKKGNVFYLPKSHKPTDFSFLFFQAEGGGKKKACQRHQFYYLILIALSLQGLTALSFYDYVTVQSLGY